jgi:prepilin-type N-terminal cleavage/methylation domain-containing protein
MLCYYKSEISHSDSRSRGTVKKRNGFTLIEVVVVIGILAIAGVVAIPNMIDWRHGLRLRAAVNLVRGDLETARARAIKENAQVTVQFVPANGIYQLTYLDGTGNTVLIKEQSLPAGLRFAADHPDYTFDSSSNRASFSSRGTAQSGTLVLENEKEKTASITVNFLGRIEVRN